MSERLRRIDAKRIAELEIVVSCGSCRKRKQSPQGHGLSCCTERLGGWSAYLQKPCSDWLPSKSDVKNLINKNIEMKQKHVNGERDSE